jgi:PAS domain S-box-containing protein
MRMRGASVDHPHRLEDAFFRSLFESDIAGLAVADLDTGVIVEVNDRMLEITGRRREELVDVPDAWRAMTPPEYHAFDLAALEQVLAGQRSDPFEKEYWRPDGSRVPVRVSTSLVPGHPGKIMVVVADLTAERRREREVENNLNQYRRLADALPALIAFIDRNLVYRFVNARYEDWFGMDSRSVIGQPLREVLGEDSFHERQAAFAEVFAGRPQRFEAEVSVRGGEPRMGEVQYIPRTDPAGEVDGFYVLVNDITERKNSEDELRRTLEALRESEARFRAMAEAAPVMIWQSGPTGETEFLNRAYLDFFGKSWEDVAKFGWVATEHPDDKERALEAYFTAMRERQAFEVENRLLSGDGRFRLLHSVGVPRFDAQGAYLGHIGTSRDVTDEREAEAKQKLLIDELNHRVKNTLAVVQSLAWQTLRDGDVPADIRHAFEQRLMALATAHDVLTSKNWSPASVEAIFRTGLGALGIGGEQLAISGPLFRVSPKTAVSLAMAVHELGTNALKYGALSVATGRVELNWEVADERFRLTWREQGGPPVSEPFRRGFGTRLIERGLAAELSGEARIAFEPDGVVCTLAAPMPPGAYAVA